MIDTEVPLLARAYRSGACRHEYYPFGSRVALECERPVGHPGRHRYWFKEKSRDE